jgi:hypothetical protein
MLWQPVPRYASHANNFAAATPNINGVGIGVTASASLHTKGSWVTMLDPIPYDTDWIAISMNGVGISATLTDALVDIGVGAAGAERVIIPNLLAGWSNNIVRCMTIPLRVPKGTRITARAQSLISADIVTVSLAILAGGPMGNLIGGFVGCDAYGINIGSPTVSQGTSITSGASGAEGAWTNVGGVTSREYCGLGFLAQGGLADTTITARVHTYDVGYGGVKLMEYGCGVLGTEMVLGPFPSWPYFGCIPAGVQLQIRGMADGAAPEPLDCALYAFY